MKLLRLITLLLFVGLCWTCAKKKYPPSLIVENDPVYYSNVTVDGEEVKMKAGLEGYYLYSSYSQDTSSVYNYLSDFRKADCQTCPLALKIEITDFRTSPPSGPMLMDSALKIKRYPYFYSGDGSKYTVQFLGNYNKLVAATDYKWNFGDGQSFEGINPTHIFSKPGSYAVCLTVKSNNSCVSSNCNVVRIGSGKMTTSILGTAGVGNNISFANNTVGGKLPLKFLWNFGDGLTATTTNASHTYQYPGSYPVTLRVIDAAADTAYTNYNAVTKTDISSCAANYEVSSVTPITGSNAWSKVRITWTDAQGNTFRSMQQQQPASSYFDIVSISEGTANEKGQPTKKVLVRFSCKAFNGQKSVNLQNAEAVIAVAYK